MKRLTIIFLSLFFIAGLAQASPHPQRLFQKDISYKEIEGATSNYQGGQVEVLELLWYGCQTCYLVQSAFEQWSASAGSTIKYQRMPAVTQDDMILLARTYYAAEVLNVLPKTHQPLFTAIHDARRKMQSETDVIEFFEEQGVAAKDFTQALNSNYVNGKLRRARIMSERFGIQGVPSVIVDGKYLVDASMVRSPAEFVEVIDYLVNKVKTTVRGE